MEEVSKQVPPNYEEQSNYPPPPSYPGPPNYPGPPYYQGQPNYQMPPNYQGQPVFQVPVNQGMYPPTQWNQSNIQNIRDYLPWSVMNLCFGGLFLGIIAVLLSMKTRSCKEQWNIESAKTWSRITLIFNIFVNLVFVAVLIFIIVYFVTVYKSVKSIYSYHY